MSKTMIEKSVKKRVKGEARKKTQKAATLDENGAEILDSQPLFHDLGFRQPETMNDKIRRITMQVQAETAAKLAAQNMTEDDIARVLDEEDDFEIPEDYDTQMTQYEAAGLVSELKDEVFIAPPPESPLVPEGDESPKDVADPPPTPEST